MMDELSQDQLRALYRDADGARWRDMLGRFAPVYAIVVVPILLIMTIGGIAESAPARDLISSALFVLAMSAVICIPIALLSILVFGRIGRARVLVEGRIAAKQTYQVPGRNAPSTKYALLLEDARYRKINRDGTLNTHRPLKQLDVEAQDFARVERDQPMRALCWSSGELIRMVE
jgi:hypothetical protein